MQMGSYVPAQDAKIGVVDQGFSRVGAADDLASNRSTFMCEMQETCNILRNVRFVDTVAHDVCTEH